MKKYTPTYCSRILLSKSGQVKPFLNGEKTLNEALLQVLFNNNSMPTEGCQVVFGCAAHCGCSVLHRAGEQLRSSFSKSTGQLLGLKSSP